MEHAPARHPRHTSDVAANLHAHGLRIRSAIPLPDLHAGAGTERGSPPAGDLELRLGPERRVPPRRPHGELLLDHVVAGNRRCAAARGETGTTLVVPGCARFHVAADGEAVTCHADPEAAPGLLPVVVTGTLLAFVLAQRGHAVLHASAVEVVGGALAVVGASGMGKSTVAAMLCAIGAPLVADDVLCVDADQLTCQRGGRELRLRAQPATALLQGAAIRRTADGRWATAPRATTRASLPLVAVVVPRPAPGTTEVAAQRLDPATAALMLARFPRTLGWTTPEPLAVNFQLSTGLAARVPVHLVTVPWGPPFKAATGQALLDAVCLEAPLSTGARRGG